MLQRTLTYILLFLSLSLTISAAGTQFITGPCTSDADCASSCCGFKSGKCAGPVIAQERDGGCGFGDAQPNDRAAVAFRAGQAAQGAQGAAGSTPSPTPAASASTSNKNSGSGKAPGTQFITGVCGSDADCASACCGFKSGKCAGPVIAQERDGGCGFGDAQPNDRAAVAFRAGMAAQNSQGAAGSTMVAVPSSAPAASPNNNGGSGKAPGTQFITGVCGSDADCASGCCGFKSGKCAGPIIAQERDGGCGFGNATPNDTAAKKLRGGR